MRRLYIGQASVDIRTALQDQPRPDGSFALIQLPPGKLHISHRLSLNVSWVILRGAGWDPKRGGTALEFKPDNNTVWVKVSGVLRQG